MPTIPEALAVAIERHHEGRLAAAEQIYRQILAADPNHAEALQLLGVIAHQVGQHDVAAQYIARAIRLDGEVAAFHNNLGEAYRASCRIAEAAVAYRRAIELEPEFAEAHYNLGVALHAAGRPGEAAGCYRRALELRPGYAEAHGNLGAALRDQGNLSEAVDCYRRALQLKPDYAMAHSNLGVALADQGKLDEAVACYRRALQLAPGYAQAHCNLGGALMEKGHLDEAVTCYRRALELKPDYAEAHNDLGNALWDQGKPAEALACFRRALELKPRLAEAHNNLGNALNDQGRLEEAVACYRRALELKPGYAEANSNLGRALMEQGNLDDAIACCRLALQSRPSHAGAHNNLGDALNQQGKLDEALACFRRALQLEPCLAEAHNNLGNALCQQGEPDEAVACYRRALQLKPHLAGAHSNLGNVLKDQGRLEEAIACCRRALELEPDDAKLHSNLLYALHYGAGVTPAVLAQAHADYDRRHAVPLRGAIAHRRDARDRQARLRLGFVSPDLARHPVGCFLVRVLECLSQQQQATICYSDRPTRDDLSHRLQAAATQWRDVFGLSDRQLANQIGADRIDVLFDLAGHTAHNRLLVFARKPAPLQITWIGYEGTTGLSAMDYLLADRYVVPEGTERHYREQVLRMPEGYVCFDPPAAAPPVGSLPAHTPGGVTLGSFNNPAKLTPQVVQAWATVLRRLPKGRLVLQYRGLGAESVRQRYCELFAACGVDPGRLTLLPHSAYGQYLAAHQRIDLALDPFPFSGSATTCAALWMGVPVVTCPGETFASRHSLSHLSNVGLTETIARDLDEYVEIAVALANDLPRLAAIRARLRQQMAASPLCDGPRFAANLMALLRDVWRRWCEGKDEV